MNLNHGRSAVFHQQFQTKNQLIFLKCVLKKFCKYVGPYFVWEVIFTLAKR